MAKNGGVASIFTNIGPSQPVTGQACSRLGSTLEYYITDRDRGWWDPFKPVVVYDGSTPVTPTEIDHAAGMLTLPAVAAGTVTVDCYYFSPEWLGGGYGFDIDPKVEKKDVTTYPSELNTASRWRKYIATLGEWTATIERHYWYGRAWTLMNCLAANADLIWTWKSYGSNGNLEQVEYVEGGALGVARSANKTTVTLVSGATTAAQVKAAVESDPSLAGLWEIDYAPGHDGSGVIEAQAAQTCSGGRDHSSDIAKLGKHILVRFYLDVRTGSLEMISGVGLVEGVPLQTKLDDVIEAPVTIQGHGRLKYHTV